jgi:predicted hydrocarbon binding protein
VTSTLPFLGTRTVSVPVDFFAALRRAVEVPTPALSVDVIRDAGYHAGKAMFDAYTAWLASRGESAPETISDVRFVATSQEFFGELGWGHLEFAALSEQVLAIDSADWAEADAAGSGCHVSTGLLAGFLGCVADATVAVFEVECRAAGDPRCRFLVGSIDVLSYVHEAMSRGSSYQAAVGSA